MALINNLGIVYHQYCSSSVSSTFVKLRCRCGDCGGEIGASGRDGRVHGGGQGEAEEVVE